MAVSRKTSRKTSKKAGRKASRRGSKKASKKGSKKASKKGSKKASKKGSKKQYYCVACKRKRAMSNGKYSKTTKNGRTTRLLKGKCPEGHNIASIVSKAEYEANK